jgi:hypothetical protein
MIGRWRSSGSVLDKDGFTVVATISGTDVYSLASSGNWIVHDVDVLMGDERTLVTELIGGCDPESDGWQMHAFDNSESPGQMSLIPQSDGTFLLQGQGVRSWLDIAAGPGLMTTRWEREIEPGTWTLWMDMRFDREPLTGGHSPPANGDPAADLAAQPVMIR